MNNRDKEVIIESINKAKSYKELLKILDGYVTQVRLILELKENE